MRHFTTRFGFVFALPFAVLLLIPLWGAFGVFSQEGSTEGGSDDHGAMAGMGGMGDAKNMFIQETQAFIAKNSRPDGCVEPAAGSMGGSMQMTEVTEGQRMEKPTVVYLQALQWAYRPRKLCLKSGVTYEFKMMATDVIHGASVQLGPGSKMVRLPPAIEVEEEITFTEPGKYLLYCSYYCGLGHQSMRGQIIVEPGPAQESSQ